MQKQRQQPVDEMQSPIYSATSVEKDQKLHDLTTRMQQQANEITAIGRDNDMNIADSANDLAETVLEFLQEAGWSRR